MCVSTSTPGLGWLVTTSPGSRVRKRFGDLDFVITTEGELAWAPVVIQPLHFTGVRDLIPGYLMKWN